MAEEIQNAGVEAVASSTPTGDAPRPPQTPARFDRVDWLGFAATTLLALTGYWLTLAPDLTLEFSGINATGAYYAGVPHPPGYPVWTLYSWCFTQLLPFSNVAWRVAVGSAVASAVACGMVAMMISRGGLVLFHDKGLFADLNSLQLGWLRKVCGTVAGLVLAFSGAVWRYAVIAETRALSLLLFVVMLWLFFRWSLAPAQRRYIVWAFFAFGLLLTNSQELIVALPALVVAVMLVDLRVGRDLCFLPLPLAVLATSVNQYHIVCKLFPIETNPPLLGTALMVLLAGISLTVITRRLGTEWKTALGCSLAMLLGLALYFYVPIASMTTPPVNWGYPRNPEGFLHVISRGQYESVWPTDDLGRFAGQVREWAGMTGMQFGWPFMAIACIPFCFIGRMSNQGRRLFGGFIAFWVCVTFLMLIETNPPPDRQAWSLIVQYFATSHAILAVWLGLGLMTVGAKFAAPNPDHRSTPHSS